MDPSISELQLQSKCFLWAWNTFPDTRGHLWHVTNEMKPNKVRVIGGNVVEESKADFRLRISKAKAAGLVPGVYDLHFFWRRRLYLFELKVGKNALSMEQVEWGARMDRHGATTYQVWDEQTFRQLFINILNQNK